MPGGDKDFFFYYPVGKLRDFVDVDYVVYKFYYAIFSTGRDPDREKV